jgi:hypothetical protein
MANILPRPPLRAEPGDFLWLDWYNKVYDSLTTVGSLLWRNIDFSGSSLSDIQSKAHGQLTGFQGGSAGERYHLTNAEHTLVQALPNISGNAGTVTNGVYTTGSYANPSWITSIDYSKLTGTVPTWNQNTTGVSGGLTLKSKAGAPTTTDIPAGQSAIYKNTTLGTVSLWVNDGGTMKSVTLL